MRYMLKGGVWKNAEDEILKAAVMKYGLNQWSRISSLMVRKSAKQCKARWYEWLDPSIKKIEWSKEEEEKLLHLAKIFPCQWRTIAPIVGRTPNQCVEHYELLLQQAQGKEADQELRKLKPGEIDPNPENKPAKPDEIDMDEDMREMLAEARVRLANTKGKKAKRKAREKIIEEARRLALMQKKREMKAAGIDYIMTKRDKIRDRKWKKVMNYNKEIPFERQVPDFKFKTGKEENPVAGGDVGNISLQTLEGPRRDEEEEKMRKIDQKKMKKLKERDMGTAISKINKLNKIHAEAVTQMVLPDPQLQDSDLELLAKLSRMQEKEPELKCEASALLTEDYYGIRTGLVHQSRTPRADNHILQQVRTVQSIIESRTPLLGDRSGQYSGWSEQNNVMTPYSIRGTETPRTTHRHQAETPLRQDLLRINQPEEEWDQDRPKKSLKALLATLPPPSNEYTLEMPTLSPLPQETPLAPDREEEVLRDVRQKKVKMARQKQRQSLAVVKGLPRPQRINTHQEGASPAERLIQNQVVHLLASDSVHFPLKGCRPELALLEQTRPIATINKGIPTRLLDQASHEIYQEMQQIKQEKGVTDQMVLQAMEEQLSTSSGLSLDQEERLLHQERAATARLLLQVDQQLAPYVSKALRLAQSIENAFLRKQSLLQQISLFSALKEQEGVSGERRVQEEKAFTALLSAKEQALQRRYQVLREEEEAL